MDGVALASVITSGVVAITTTGWSARQNVKLARETRTQQRLADSYLEVLRIVEREGQWVEAIITNREIAKSNTCSALLVAERVHNRGVVEHSRSCSPQVTPAVGVQLPEVTNKLSVGV